MQVDDTESDADIYADVDVNPSLYINVSHMT